MRNSGNLLTVKSGLCWGVTIHWTALVDDWTGLLDSIFSCNTVYRSKCHNITLHGTESLHAISGIDRIFVLKGKLAGSCSL
jgi:hypothetical protein